MEKKMSENEQGKKRGKKDEHGESESQAAFDFWNSHSERFLEMALRTGYRGRLEHPDAYGKRTGDCGDTVEFFLTVENESICDILFDVHGCLNTTACANTVVELAREKSLEEAWKIGPESIENYLETLPPDHRHCAELAAGAFYRALADYREMKRSPWKKMYGNR